jgi:hypothetical protein
VRRFRRRFVLAGVPDRFLVYVSADSRYRLWVNGRPVGRGPLKGTLQQYHYACYDLAPYLRGGKNVIAAEVRWFGQHTPTSEVHSPRPGFLFQGPEDANLDTPRGWAVFVDHAVRPDVKPYISNAHHFLGHWEIVDACAYPQGWQEPDYDDAGWEAAIDAGPADVSGFWGETHPYQTLYPRDVPALVEEPRRFARTYRAGQQVGHLFGAQPAGWTLEPGQGGEIVLDVGHLTTGYPELDFSGGAGRTVEVIYGECLLHVDDRDGYRAPAKGVRDDWSYGDVHGYRDTILLSGGAFDYEPFHWRTFWYVKVRRLCGR